MTVDTYFCIWFLFLKHYISKLRVYVVECTEDGHNIPGGEYCNNASVWGCYSEWCCLSKFSPILRVNTFHALLLAVYLGTENSLGYRGFICICSALASIDAAKYFSKATVPMLANFLLENFLDSSLKFALHSQPPIRSSSFNAIMSDLFRLPRYCLELGKKKNLGLNDK